MHDSSSGAVTRSPSGVLLADPPLSDAQAVPAKTVRRELISGSPSRSSRRARIKAVICDVFGRRCRPALNVALCETGGTLNPYARGSAGERGLFQIHPVHFRWVRRMAAVEPQIQQPGRACPVTGRTQLEPLDVSAVNLRHLRQAARVDETPTNASKAGRRPGKGIHGQSGSSLVLREHVPEFACQDCIIRLQYGVAVEQGTLL